MVCVGLCAWPPNFPDFNHGRLRNVGRLLIFDARSRLYKQRLIDTLATNPLKKIIKIGPLKLERAAKLDLVSRHRVVRLGVTNSVHCARTPNRSTSERISQLKLMDEAFATKHRDVSAFLNNASVSTRQQEQRRPNSVSRTNAHSNHVRL